MAQSFFFYDLETSGLSPRNDRIMQFAGQRTDMNLHPVGEPHNILIKLNDDTLPSPEAVMVTGITPQATQADGLTEAEFAQLLLDEVCIADTIMVGFNNIRFDDEFIRHLFWRTFRDPYEWSWSESRSRWDMLDVIRMTRALRPEGIEWPFDEDNKPTNRLELLTKVNGITHTNAHDALADVEALIAVTKLVQQAQPNLFQYLLTMRSKKSVQQLVNLQNPAPFVYTSGRYDIAHHKTTIAYPLAPAPNQNVVVYDLRYDPTPFLVLTQNELQERLFASWEKRTADDFVPIPVKTLQYNRAPAVAPLGVLEQADGWQKLSVTPQMVQAHMKILSNEPEFAERIRTALEAKPAYPELSDAEAKLYDGFIHGVDKVRIEAVRNADEQKLVDFQPEFKDERLHDLLLRYKARNYPTTLSEDEVSMWEEWRSARLQSQLPAFLGSLQKLAGTTDNNKQFLLQELQLWAEAILPADDI